MDKPDMARAVGERLLRVAARLDAVIDEATAEEGLTGVQARLLALLPKPVAQSEIAEQLGVDASRISVLVKDLERRDLVVRRAGLGDRRVRLVELSEKGLATRARIGARLLARSPLMGLPADDLHALLHRLEPLDPSPHQEGAPP